MPRLWFAAQVDPPDPILRLFVEATGEDTAAAIETFTYPQDLAEFGEQLKMFPRHLEDQAVLESGSADPGSHVHFRLRAFVIDRKGHSALEIIMDNRKAIPDLANCHFFLECNPADVNRLGAALVAWSARPERPLSFEWK